MTKTPTPSEVTEYLQKNPDLDLWEKSVVYTWFMDKPIIKDHELPEIYQNTDSLCALLSAWRSNQYHRYIVHLFIAFIVNVQDVHFLSGHPKEAICGITGKKVYPIELWDSNRDPQKETIGITNSVNGNTDQVLSKEAIIELGRLYNLLESVEPNKTLL